MSLSPDVAVRKDPQAMAARLRELLTERAEYRMRWERQPGRRVSEPVNGGKVARVLAEYLWESGEVADSETDLPRRLKDTVSRCLSGQVVSATTVRWFVGAFRMTEYDSAQLWALLYGRDPARLAVVRDDLDVETAPAPPRPAHQTVSIHEFHRVGPDGLPESHRTVHMLRALESFTRYPYVFDTDAAAVEVVRGGVASPLYQLPEHGMFAVDLITHDEVPAGHTVSLEYLTLFSYRSAPPTEFRRGTRQRLENLEVNVTFHPERRPARVWWSRWDDHTQRRPVSREPVELARDLTVHRFLDVLTDYTVGFEWSWV